MKSLKIFTLIGTLLAFTLTYANAQAVVHNYDEVRSITLTCTGETITGNIHIHTVINLLHGHKSTAVFSSHGGKFINESTGEVYHVVDVHIEGKEKVFGEYGWSYMREARLLIIGPRGFKAYNIISDHVIVNANGEQTVEHMNNEYYCY